MSVDSEILELDERGIFPTNGESGEEFIKRGTLLQEISNWRKYPNFLSYFQYVKTEYHTDIYLFPEEAQKEIRKAQEEFHRRFQADLRWVPVFAFVPSPDTVLGVESTASAQIFVGVDEIKTRLSCIFLNAKDHFTVSGFRKTAKHEMTHSVRSVAEVCLYYSLEEQKWEETLARYGERRSDPIFPSLPTKLSRVRKKLKRLFGPLHNYALIRTHPSVHQDMIYGDLSCEQWKDQFCVAAEKGDLRYRIFKERAGW